MLRSVLKLSVLVLSVVAIWLTLSQPNTAFAQNPTPAVSNRTFIGPAPSDTVPTQSSLPDTQEPVDDPSTPATKPRAEVTPWSFGWRFLAVFILLAGAVMVMNFLFGRRGQRKLRKRERGSSRKVSRTGS